LNTFVLNSGKSVKNCTADTTDAAKVNCSVLNTHFHRNWTTTQKTQDLQFTTAGAENVVEMFAFIETKSTAANATPSTTIVNGLTFKPTTGYTAKTLADAQANFVDCPIAGERKATLAECTASITCAKTDAVSVVQPASQACADGYTIDA
jgi:hypothetical protein